MTDEELLTKTSAARGLAHRAPFAEWSKDHKGPQRHRQPHFRMARQRFYDLDG